MHGINTSCENNCCNSALSHWNAFRSHFQASEISVIITIYKRYTLWHWFDTEIGFSPPALTALETQWKKAFPKRSFRERSFNMRPKLKWSLGTYLIYSCRHIVTSTNVTATPLTVHWYFFGFKNYGYTNFFFEKLTAISLSYLNRAIILQSPRIRNRVFFPSIRCGVITGCYRTLDNMHTKRGKYLQYEKIFKHNAIHLTCCHQ